MQLSVYLIVKSIYYEKLRNTYKINMNNKAIVDAWLDELDQQMFNDEEQVNDDKQLDELEQRMKDNGLIDNSENICNYEKYNNCSGKVTDGPDPYLIKFYDDNTSHQMCESCRKQSNNAINV